MTWTKLGDEFADECWRLTDEAFRLHTEGLVWSNAKHLDGLLAKAEMHRWAHYPHAAEELVNLGFWEDHGQHYQIYAHQGWQRTAESWLHQSAVNSANGRKGGRPRKPRKPPKTESLSESLSESQSETESERDGTGRAWKGSTYGDAKKNGSVKKNGDKPDEFPLCNNCGEWTARGDTATGWENPEWCRSCNEVALADLSASQGEETGT